MKSKKLCALILVALINACSPINQSYSIDGQPKAVSFTINKEQIQKISDSDLVKANNTFGLKLFSEIAKEQKDKNVFISPASVALALQMSYNGADKQTKEEMAKALEINNLSLADVNNLNQLLIKKLNSPTPDINLKVVNSIWGGKGRINFKQTFKDDLNNFYNAEASELDFSSAKTLELINGWASKNTNGKIPKIIDKIDDRVVSYLINAIYFKADWTEKFKTSETQQRDFTLADGTKKQHPLMSSFRGFRYFSELNSDNNFEAAELTYGKDAKVSLYLFLPDQNSSLEKFYTQLNNDNLDKWFKRFYNSQGYISFPKFKNNWDSELSANLKSLGMTSAFDTSADFSRMADSPLGNIYISRVLHRTFIEVNEEGSEAAAVTAVEDSAVSSAPTPRFVADRPFFYVIRDNETKSILFMGSVNNPEYK